MQYGDMLECRRVLETSAQLFVQLVNALLPLFSAFIHCACCNRNARHTDFDQHAVTLASRTALVRCLGAQLHLWGMECSVAENV